MKVLVFLLFLLVPCFGINSQAALVTPDSVAYTSHSIRLIAQVKDLDQDYILIEVEEIVSFTNGIYITPASGDEILVRLPGREVPKKESRIEIDLQEKVDVGAMPTGYIMTSFRIID
jgi:hypothetical protein